MWLANRFSFLREKGSAPSLVLVTPDWKGQTGWNYCEGWINTLAEMGRPVRAFHVGDKPGEIKSLFKYLHKNTPELVLVSCGDHHLYHLHNTEEKREFWRHLKARSVCFCNERVVNSPFPMSLEKTKSAVDAFDAFVYADEFAESIYGGTGKPAMWTPQFSDENFFRPTMPYEQRRNHVYFRGTLTNFGFKGVYDERLAVVEAIRNNKSFVIHSDLLSSKQYAQELGEQRFVLRAASNCPGYVESFWNLMACGCVVFHQKLPKDEVKSAGLLVHGRDFLEYDGSNPQQLLLQAEEVLKNWPDYKHVSDSARKIFLEKYTLRIFLEKLLHFADTQVKSK